MRTTIVIVLIILIAACQPENDSPTASSGTLINVEQEIRTLNQTTERRWIETETDGVRIGMWLPSGWAVDTSQGIIMAEHFTGVENGVPNPGMLVYIFVPPLDRFNLEINAEANAALHVLNQVVRMPTELGANVAATSPVAFTWDDLPAAYYLLTGTDGVRTLVMAVELEDHGKLVVCNVSIPGSQASRIRELLPRLLDDFRVNDLTLSGAGLNVLPNPLSFPRTDPSAMLSTEVAPSSP